MSGKQPLFKNACSPSPPPSLPFFLSTFLPSQSTGLLPELSKVPAKGKISQISPIFRSEGKFYCSLRPHIGVLQTIPYIKHVKLVACMLRLFGPC